MHPRAALDGPLGASPELRVRPLDLHRELLEPLVRVHPRDLAGRRLRTRHLPAEQARERARARVLQALGVDPELGELLARHRRRRDGAPRLLHAARHLDEGVERDAQPHLEAEAEREALRRLTGRPEWSGGAASLGERKIYVYRSDEAFGILAHELTHIYFDSFFPPSNPSPLWLSEGVATYVQSERGLSTPNWLDQNLKLLEGGSGFKLADLVRIENMQEADEDNVRLWYAQAYSVVRFLMKLKAGDSFYVFCKELRDGKPANQALYRAYGMPYNRLSSLEYAWRYDLKTGKISGVNR